MVTNEEEVMEISETSQELKKCSEELQMQQLPPPNQEEHGEGDARRRKPRTNFTVSSSGQLQLDRLLSVLAEKNGMPITQENGQRRYGPSLDSNIEKPPKGSEVFVGKLPRDCFEPEIVPVFEKVGKIYELRLMMDFSSGTNRGYCFVHFSTPAEAEHAVEELNNYEIRKGHQIGVVKSVDNSRLYIGRIPKDKDEEEIRTELDKLTEGIVKVIIYPCPEKKETNRGFAFIEYESHEAAAIARRALLTGKSKMWNSDIAVDWAEPEPGIRVLFVRNINPKATEKSIKLAFNEVSNKGVEEVRIIRDFAFVHFYTRQQAEMGKAAMDNTTLEGNEIQIQWARAKSSDMKNNGNVSRFWQTGSMQPAPFRQHEMKRPQRWNQMEPAGRPRWNNYPSPYLNNYKNQSMMYNDNQRDYAQLRLDRLQEERANMFNNLADRTGMPITQENGYRRYGPPIHSAMGRPSKDCEIFVGKLPRDCFESELVPIFERAGRIYELRLMMDFSSGTNRGHCFVQYFTPADADRAIQELNNYEIRKGHYIGIVKAIDNNRLYIGRIPRDKDEEEIHEELNKLTCGVTKVIVYPSLDKQENNRGFAFVEYESHEAAASARNSLISGKSKIWNTDIAVDWAEPEPGIRVLFVRNISPKATEKSIKQAFNEVSNKGVEEVRIIRDFAFVHFYTRQQAEMGKGAMDNTTLDGNDIQIQWARAKSSEMKNGNVSRFWQNDSMQPAPFRQHEMRRPQRWNQMEPSGRPRWNNYPSPYMNNYKNQPMMYNDTQRDLAQLRLDRLQEERVKMLNNLADRTGMPITQENGYRRYGPPIHNNNMGRPSKDCEIFVGKLPRDCFEPELVPIFEKAGRIYELRLMMDFSSGTNRGHCFVQYFTPADADRATQKLNNYEIRKGHYIGIVKSIDNYRLYIGRIPRDKDEEEIHEELDNLTNGVTKVVVYPSLDKKEKNRGFAFVEYENHEAATVARRKLISGKLKMWGFDIAVDWAEPEPGVQVLFVRNLKSSTTEESISQVFNDISNNGVEKVRIIRDFAFIHFFTRQQAEMAKSTLENTTLDGDPIQIQWARSKSGSVNLNRSMHNEAPAPVTWRNPLSPNIRYRYFNNRYGIYRDQTGCMWYYGS